MSELEAMSPQEEWLIEPRGEGLAKRFSEFFAAHKLLRYFAAQSVSKTYRRTYLGSLWLFIRPLFPLLIGLFVFQGLVGEHVTETPYLIFYVSGLCIWQLFAQGLAWITRSLETNRRLLKKLYFPRLILPVAFIAPAAVEFCIQIVVLVAVALYYLATTGLWHLHVSWASALSLFGAVGLTLGLALGIGFWTSVMAAEARDVRYLIGYVLGFWQYLTPVFYPLEAIPESYRWILKFNPMGCACELFRKGVLGVGGVATEDVVIATTMVALIFGVGLFFFTRFEQILADHV